MRYSIVYSTRTGNTRLLAEQVREALPAEDCVYFGEADEKALEADRIYVGFWTDKGCCDSQTADFLKTLRDKEVVLFGSAGFGQDQSYFDKILKRTEGKLDKSVKVAGTFMCQGRMPQAVRDRYVKMKSSPVHMPNLDQLIENFDQALSHPDEADLTALRERVVSLG